MSLTLARYFGARVLTAFTAIFVGVFGLVMLVDYLELMRRHADLTNTSALLIAKTSIYRVPQVVERILPFGVLIAAMSSFLTLSRRLEFVIARAAGMSAWQFTAPALFAALALGFFATMVYNPVAAILAETSKRMEADFTGRSAVAPGTTAAGIWLRQRGADGQSIMSALTSREQGLHLGTVTVFAFDHENRFLERIEAKAATLEPGRWILQDARVFAIGAPPADRATYILSTNLTAEQVQEKFSTPDTVPFWELPAYILSAQNAGLSAAAYTLQYQKLLSRPFLLASMVLIAAAFSLRFFRFGGVQKMVLGGVAAGFLIYVGSKLTDDLSKAEMISPIVAAWLPTAVGGLAGFLALLHLEDG
jgi:lipopolysaccharide export system permease protein